MLTHRKTQVFIVERNMNSPEVIIMKICNLCHISKKHLRQNKSNNGILLPVKIVVAKVKYTN